VLQQTSLDSYEALIRDRSLGDRQKAVLLCLREEGPANNRLLAFRLNKPINTVTPRVLELRERGLVAEAFRQRDQATGMTTIFWRAVT
jgi:DNA-binding MarR family transcriptional regulator